MPTFSTTTAFLLAYCIILLGVLLFSVVFYCILIEDYKYDFISFTFALKKAIRESNISVFHAPFNVFSRLIIECKF